jgi:hypothetical protein
VISKLQSKNLGQPKENYEEVRGEGREKASERARERERDLRESQRRCGYIEVNRKMSSWEAEERY